MQPWTERSDPSATHELQAEGKRDGAMMVFRLGPLGDTSDQLLAVSVRGTWGDASYLWRLNPAK